jgi:hypothetical protein
MKVRRPLCRIFCCILRGKSLWCLASLVLAYTETTTADLLNLQVVQDCPISHRTVVKLVEVS